MSEKIRTDHLERAAYVYVRQSTLHQVRHHREGQQRQYGLADRARQLGFGRVVVIDDDLGTSGSGRQPRLGFGRLLTAVCEGAVGAVFALEASRLARNNRDWHHLIDLCGMTETVLVDDDGIYDPRLVNDRLLLGLKGTMSEFELSLFRQRAREAFEQKVRRGCVLWEVPVGFVRTGDDRVEKSADRQIQSAIQIVIRHCIPVPSAPPDGSDPPPVRPEDPGVDRSYLLRSGSERSPLRSPFHAWADQPILHYPGIQECPDKFQQPLVLDSLGDPAHSLTLSRRSQTMFSGKNSQ